MYQLQKYACQKGQINFVCHKLVVLGYYHLSYDTSVMKEQKSTPEDLVSQFFERVWSPPHDLTAIDEIMAEDYRITTAGSLITGRENFKEWVKNFQTLLLEARTESIEMFMDESKSNVVSRWKCSGKNNGLFGLEPDHKQVVFTGIAIWEAKDDKLSECWVERSGLELLEQLKGNVDQRLI